MHLHVLQTYPDNKFDVIMHILIDVTASHQYLKKTYQKNETIQQYKTEIDLINKIFNQLHCILIKAGAQNITIQPHISGSINGNEVWKSCIKDKCSENNGCCIKTIK